MGVEIEHRRDTLFSASGILERFGKAFGRWLSSAKIYGEEHFVVVANFSILVIGL